MSRSDLRRYQWILVCEGNQDLNFFYHWLRAQGVPPGKIVRRAVGAGRGAGEQHVRLAYAREVLDLRSRAHLALVLVVAIDADVLSVAERMAQLDAQVARGPQERVMLAIPRRNIETWIHYLSTPPADEQQDYKPKSAEDCKQAARTLAQLRAPPEDAPDSLRRFFQELRRVE